MTTGTAQELDWQAMLTEVLTLEGSLGDIYCRFYDYSYLNQVLMYMQGLREPVATYNRWRDAGRQVRKGSKARGIVRPIVVKRRDDSGEDTGEVFKRFKMVRCIFPLSDTDGPDIELPELPGWSLGRAGAELGITRESFTDLSGNVQGYSHGSSYAVSPVAVYPLKTAVHELAHIVLGHTAGDERSHHTRGVKEFQAETVAYIVLSEIGDASQWSAESSRAYVQQWLAQDGSSVSDAHIRAVFTAANKILTAGRPARVQAAEVAA